MGKLVDRHGESHSEQYAWKMWGRMRLTVLDEIGRRRRPSDHHRETVQTALDLRVNQPAIFIANEWGEDMVGDAANPLLGGPVISRLVAGTRFFCGGPDRRIAGGETCTGDSDARLG